jgi:phenylacetate-CoA ligase
MAVATVSVREDMATAVIGALGPHFDQLLVIADPLFTPCLLAHASNCGVEWRRHDTKFLLGEEFFGESFRSFVGRRLGYSSEELNTGVIRSSFGVGELGLHVLYETPVTIALRRDAAQDSTFAKDIFKTSTPVQPVPMLLTYDDDRTYVEVDDPDETGFGNLTLTMLSADGALPLIRYQTGDLAALLDEDDISTVARRHGIRRGGIPRHVVALRGRRADMLQDGCHLSTYKEALFASDDLASAVTGAYRVEPTADGITLHVQLMPGLRVQSSMEGAIRHAFGSGKAPRRIRVWRYDTFPFGMRLDYERKFRYYPPCQDS